MMFDFFKKSKKKNEGNIPLNEREGIRIPTHIAFIMDGNGRYATRYGLPRELGHSKGADVFRDIIRYCGDVGVTHITVYAFSTENWKRSEEEVSAIMKLLDRYIDDAQKDFEKEKLRVVFLGDKSPFPKEFIERMEKLERDSSKFGRILNVALNYGGRDEIVHAANEAVKSGVSVLTEDIISQNLYSKLSPDPDLVVRTAGEYRISNFLLWQSAYAEYYFTDKLWPEMTHDDVDLAIESYSKRERRFGGRIQKDEKVKTV